MNEYNKVNDLPLHMHYTWERQQVSYIMGLLPSTVEIQESWPYLDSLTINKMNIS